MAEHLVLTALENLKDIYDKERDLMQFIESEKQKLESNLKSVVAVLADAEENQLQDTSHAVREWLQKLKDALFVLDDILDECSTEAIREKYEADRSFAFLSFLYPQKFQFRRNISDRIKDIEGKLELIAREKNDFGLNPSGTEWLAKKTVREWNPTSSDDDDGFVLGRDLDRDKIVGCLLGENCKADKLSVYPIVGLGGMGKSTLARLVYKNQRVSDDFQLKIWVYVSRNFDLAVLLKDIIASAHGTIFSHETHVQLQVLVDELKRILGGKRYLLVLDDVWNSAMDKWNQLRNYLECGLEGSAVLVTTREDGVADETVSANMEKHVLQRLSTEACQEILWNLTFGSGIPRREDLVKIGKEIAGKCEGVPLAVTTIGGLLSSDSDESWWLHVKSKLWVLSQKGDSIMGALKLSYVNLPSDLRACFAYCAVFPKGYRIQKQRLIHHWGANGLISYGGTSMEAEDGGDKLVRQLRSRSLIQLCRTDENGKILSFKIHDLIHDVLQLVMGEESIILIDPSSANLAKRTRHLLIDCESESSIASSLVKEEFDSLRTLIMSKRGFSVPIYLLQTRLRALDLSRLAELKVLPSLVSDLKHLRYLNLSRTKIEALPESICSLCNLQILNLNWCRDLQKLPRFIGRLKGLQHLYLYDCWRLTSMPQSMGQLTSLRSLTFVIVGDHHQELGFELSKLGSFKYLRGGLAIKSLETVKDVKHAVEAKLMEKQNLNQLSFSWGLATDINDQQQQQQQEILGALRPDSKLKKLEVNGYKGFVLPDWMKHDIASFTRIEFVAFRSCKNISQLAPLWTLPCLKELRLETLDSLRYLIEGQDSNHNGLPLTFFKLERLTLHSLPNLERIISREEAKQEANAINIFPRLSQLKISKCPRLSSFKNPHLPSLRFYQW